MMCRELGWCRPLALAIAVLLVGCQPGLEDVPTVAIQGKLTDGGQPLTVENPKYGYRWVEIRFHPLTNDGQAGGDFRSVEVKPDGSFSAEIPSGKYRVAVHQWEGPAQDKLQNKFDWQNSTITREVTAGANIEIDLSNP